MENDAVSHVCGHAYENWRPVGRQRPRLGGFGAGVYSGAGVQHSHKRPPINSLYFPSNVLFYFSNLSSIPFYFYFFSLTRLTYITTVVDRSPLLSRAGNSRRRE